LNNPTGGNVSRVFKFGGKMTEQISMKSTKNGSTGDMPAVKSERPEYPWGLQLNLENESIEKLGLDISKMHPGQTGKLICEFEIRRIGNEKMADGKERKELSLQITSMAKPTVKNRIQAGSDLLNRMRGL
jgi:hypothetical protein